MDFVIPRLVGKRPSMISSSIMYLESLAMGFSSFLFTEFSRLFVRMEWLCIEVSWYGLPQYPSITLAHSLPYPASHSIVVHPLLALLLALIEFQLRLL